MKFQIFISSQGPSEALVLNQKKFSKTNELLSFYNLFPKLNISPQIFIPLYGNNYLLAYVWQPLLSFSQYVRKSKHQQKLKFQAVDDIVFPAVYLYMIRKAEATAVVLQRNKYRKSNICVTLLNLLLLSIIQLHIY